MSAEVVGQLPGDGGVPAGDEHRRYRRNVEVESALPPALEPAEVRLGGGLVVLAREQQCHVHRDTGSDELLDRRDPLGRARHLDEQVRCRRLLVERLGLGDRALRVVRQLG